MKIIKLLFILALAIPMQVFALADASAPTKIQIPFGNSAGGAYIRTIPITSQIGIQNGAASYTDGFPPLNFTPVGAGGVPPFGQDMNGILYSVSSHARWWAAGGPVFYDSAYQTAIGGYPAGACVQSLTTTARIWCSTVDNNTTNPDIGGANWQYPNNAVNAINQSGGTVSATTISASGQITSTIGTGTAPFVIASTTPVANLSIGGIAQSANTTTSGATGVTVTAPDNSTKLATTAFVKASGLQSNYTAYFATQILSATDCGKATTISATAGTIFYLPYAASVGNGCVISLFPQNGGYATISRQGAPDTISSGGQISLTSIRLQVGDSIVLVSDGVSAWQQVALTHSTQYTTQTTPLPGPGIQIAQSHTMGDANFNAVLQFICLTAELGYSIGDIAYASYTNDTGNHPSLWQSATQVGAGISPSAAVWQIRTKDGSTISTATVGNWAYRFALTR